MTDEQTTQRVNGFRSALSFRGFRTTDIYRALQDDFIAAHGGAVTGDVIEIGGESHYDHQRLFPKAKSFTVTNVARDFEHYLSVTAMDLPDASQDAFLCVSVLEHVDDIQQAFTEIARTLKPDGTLLLSIPFLYPIHDVHDAWRVSRDGYDRLLGPDLEITAFEHLGGRISTVAMLLQRPFGSWKRRYVPFKVLGALFVAAFARFDQPDDSPVGFGVVARRRG